MLAQIATITDRPVRYVINTNNQPHRILGNAAFRDAGAEVPLLDVVDVVAGEAAAQPASTTTSGPARWR